MAVRWSLLIGVTSWRSHGDVVIWRGLSEGRVVVSLLVETLELTDDDGHLQIMFMAEQYTFRIKVAHVGNTEEEFGLDTIIS